MAIGTGFTRWLWIGVLALSLSGCAALNAPTEHTSELSVPGPAISTFQITGRALLRQGTRVDHFRFDWTHTPANDALLITTPFGQGLARLQRDDTGAHLHLPDGRSASAANLNTLAQEIFGRPLPLEALAHWLRGAHPQRIGRHEDWLISIEATDHVMQAETSAEPGSHILPRTLEFTNAETTLRLVIDNRGDTQ